MENNQRFTPERFDALSRISQRFFGEIPSFAELWNVVIEADMRLGPFTADPLHDLLGYIRSLRNVCEQGLYAIDQLISFSNHESSNITEFFVAHYFCDFISRVKTGTDLLALSINHVYRLDLNRKMCAMENGYIVGRLRSHSPSKKEEELAKEMDRIRNGWLGAFDELRDLAVHRAGFDFTYVGGESYPVHVQLPLPRAIPRDVPITYDPNQPLDALKPFAQNNEPFLEFLAQTQSQSLSKYLITIDPVVFCEEVWKLWSVATERILTLCKKDVLALCSSNLLAE